MAAPIARGQAELGTIFRARSMIAGQWVQT
jgi:hypothetical protein